MKRILPLIVILWTAAAVAQDFPEKKIYSGTVTTPTAEIYSIPSFQSQVIARMKLGQRIQILTHTKSFFGIQFKTASGATLDGWIVKTSVRMDPTVPSPVPVVPKPASSIEEQNSDESFLHALKIIAGPAFNIRRFGTTQYRFGVAYDFPITSEFSMGVPVSFAFGGGFSSLQGGLNLYYRVIQWKNADTLARLGLLGERLQGNGRAVLAGTVDAGFSFRYRMAPSFSIGLEPGVETMVVNNKNIPWNLRAQVLLELRGEW